MRYLLLFILPLALLYSCAPVYVPNTRNAPLFVKAGEFQGAMQLGTNGLDLQGAVAVTNNIAVMANYSYGNRNTDTLNRNDTENYHKHKLYEGAIGYYKNDEKFCFEIFLGYGVGEATSIDNYSFGSVIDGYAHGKFTRIFLQPSFGMNKKVVTVAFTPRLSIVDFSEFVDTDLRIANKTYDPQPKLFIEPAVTARFNFLDNRFFASIQVGVSTTLADNVVFDFQPVNITTGLGFRLGGLRWNEKSPQSTVDGQ
jgi:hypothetical protein